MIEGADDLDACSVGLVNPAFVDGDENAFRGDADGSAEPTYVAYSTFGDISFGNGGLPAGFADVGECKS